MNILKLSLIAVISAGAMSSLSAAPLEDAIKDIDVSGFGRYRYESQRTKLSGYGVKFGPDNFLPSFKELVRPINDVKNLYSSKDKSSNAFHRFTLDMNFKALIDDNFFTFVGVRYDAADISGSGVNAKNSGISNTHGGLSGINGGWGGAGSDSLSIRQYYAGYKGIPDTLITFGRQPISSFFTDDVVGTGVKVINTSIDGLSFGAFAFDNIEQDGDIPMGFYDPKVVLAPDDPTGEEREGLAQTYLSYELGGATQHWQNNFYGASIVGSWENFGFVSSIAHLQNVVTLWVFEGNTYAPLNEKLAFRGKAQVGGSYFDRKMLRAHNQEAAENEEENMGYKPSDLHHATFVGVTGGLVWDYFSIDLGYVHFGNLNRVSMLTLEDDGGYIKAGEDLINYTLFSGNNHAVFVKTALNYDAFSAGFEYVYNKARNSNKEYPSEDMFLQNRSITGHEFVVRAGYKYNEKLSFNAWHSWVSLKQDSSTEPDGYIRPEATTKNQRFRFDAVYKF